MRGSKEREIKRREGGGEGGREGRKREGARVKGREGREILKEGGRERGEIIDRLTVRKTKTDRDRQTVRPIHSESDREQTVNRSLSTVS